MAAHDEIKIADGLDYGTDDVLRRPMFRRNLKDLEIGTVLTFFGSLFGLPFLWIELISKFDARKIGVFLISDLYIWLVYGVEPRLGDHKICKYDCLLKVKCFSGLLSKDKTFIYYMKEGRVWDIGPIPYCWMSYLEPEMGDFPFVA